MFHQLKVPEQQKNYLRFLWWKDSDSDKVVIDHEMTAHVFGGVFTLIFKLWPKKNSIR